jgi:hypothetical protein
MKLAINRDTLKGFDLDSSEIADLVDTLRGDDTDDFSVGDHRFIRSDEIDRIMAEELESDLYCLGCCTDWFIADITGLDLQTVQDAHKAESFELLGALMAKQIDEVQSSMVSHDGYGHHFNHYDGNEEEIKLAGVDYYVFRTN